MCFNLSFKSDNNSVENLKTKNESQVVTSPEEFSADTQKQIIILFENGSCEPKKLQETTAKVASFGSVELTSDS